MQHIRDVSQPIAQSHQGDKKTTSAYTPVQLGTPLSLCCTHDAEVGYGEDVKAVICGLKGKVMMVDTHAITAPRNRISPTSALGGSPF